MAEFIDDSNDIGSGEDELSVVEQLVKAETKVEDNSDVSSIPDKYKGKNIEDVIKMHQEAEKLIGKQAQEVGEVRKLADDLIKQSLSVSSKPTQPTEVEPEIDFFEDPKKAVQRTLESHPDVIAARQATTELKKMQTQQRLASEHPDFGQIVQDPEFAEWVKASPVRLNLYAQADSQYDFDSANELLTTFKSLKNVKTQQKVEQAKQVTERNLKAATVDTGGTGESSKRVFRRADLIRLHITDPDRYNALETEIMAAYAEGRVK